MTISFTIPGLRLISEANQREHWGAKLKRKKSQQKLLLVFWRNHVKRKFTPPLTVTITRQGVHKMDSDNLAGAGKHIRDQIARELRIDDGSDLITWRYEQRTGTRDYAVEITITESPEQAVMFGVNN